MSLQVRLFQKLDRLSLRHADKVVTLCQPFVRQLGLLGVASDRIAVIRNAVAPKQRPTEAALALFRTALGLVSTDTVIVSVGRLSREKGHADLIRAGVGW
jgi:glycosyltransferase involved in cell wall biosynthesis